ncbi:MULTISPECIES: hypothetical protein [unclassified Mesorhizobium]|uniref:hypothetical protein n=1 Tax=unclassified Mesorhizobium TaxID=325217 RepID=UPI000FDB27FA|nr:MULTISPECIES: hypothetical protein [unclassified Mesorhizobium]TGQ09008.1 hypothetical protein EN862_022515 [Mesorhizobium sp. M2E.F.Ca.ET.219.01.1.1]TGT69543.1 hypothetical protein EN809_024795 [Mesorhizobium sp. M2E.F.Ca.ET.166.01.1.1]TGW01874.1 hypothetical protein EN797_016285 [Mesorhizobium sp. M2E.F.Ca.ET.154.01.1.1]
MSAPEMEEPAADQATGSLGEPTSGDQVDRYQNTAVAAFHQQARLAELEARRDQLVAENAGLKARAKKLGDMFEEWRRGGFQEVIRGKDEVIRVLRTRVEREIADGASWRRSAEFFRAIAERRP